jgi:hypothetical protein
VAGGTNGNFGGAALFANYALNAGSPAVDYVPVAQNHPTTDFFGNPRPDPAVPTKFDVGAIEFQGVGTGGGGAIVAVTPTSLAFGTVTVGSNSATQTLTLSNTGTAAFTGLTVAVTAQFNRPAGATGGTCTATLAAGATCTINIRFSPTTAGAKTGTATITGNVAVTGSPVSLTGTGAAQGTLTFSSATNGTLGTFLGVRTLTFTIPAPRAAVTSVVTITNSGAGNLQITAESLSVNIGTLYSITGTTCSFTSPLAPAGTCTVSIRYATPATRPTIPDIGAASVANNGTTGPNTTLALVAQ